MAQPSEEQQGERPSPRQLAGQRRRWRYRRRFALDTRNIWALCLLVCLGAGMIVGWSLVVHAQEVVVLGFVLLALLFGAVGAGWAALACMGASVALLLPFLPLFLPRVEALPAGCRFSVLTFNVETKRTQAPVEPAMAALLARHAADVLLLQDVPRVEAMMAALRAEPAFARHQMLPDPSGATNLIASRFPFEPLPADDVGQLVLARVAGRPLRFLTGVGPKELFTGGRERFAGQLDRVLANTSQPLLLGMDLNAGARSDLLLSLRRHLLDAHQEAGWGFGFTFPTPERRIGSFGSWLRLDYLLHDPRMATVSVAVIPEHGISTHRPVRAELVLIGAGEDGRPC